MSSRGANPPRGGSWITDRHTDPVGLRHLILRTTNLEIGQALGGLAMARYGLSADRFLGNTRLVRARRAYFEHHYSIHWQRMRGVAAAFGMHPEDDRFDFSNLLYGTGLPGRPRFGSTAVYFPPATTVSGHGHLSRMGELAVETPPEKVTESADHDLPSRRRLATDLYLTEWYPTDGGYASLAVQTLDLLSGTLDGLNSEGLVVAALTDLDAVTLLSQRIEGQDSVPSAVGLHELQIARLLLDACATVDDAQAALLRTQDFYFSAPTRLLVADRTGRSFVYARSRGRNVQHITEGEGEPQLLSTLELCLPLSPKRAARELIDAHCGRIALDEIQRPEEAALSIRRRWGAPSWQRGDVPGARRRRANLTPVRRWHSLYDQADGTLTVRVRPGEEDDLDPTSDGPVIGAKVARLTRCSSRG